jgi:prolyl-tRNA editing enzyme YbaK/EbsC (Cys-tRNA(Pro) deacylase)
MRLLADRSVLEPELLSLGAGVSNTGVILSRDDLLRTLSPEIGRFTD